MVVLLVLRPLLLLKEVPRMVETRGQMKRPQLRRIARLISGRDC
ncbi:hypothetical protein GLYMA_16G184900v4 [Glycine max]|uniref:Uncharacterized protein n=1 Tax=Glycine max TaxID=3847 RepID=A0A0R0FS88_SOYBN|nr:hypothetical protein GLYMA_16G184900v4 [Glycine max]